VVTPQLAEQLINLAALAAARQSGVLIDDATGRFSMPRRTAQRMLQALETQFPDTRSAVDVEGRKRWRLTAPPLRDLMSVSAEELAAIDLAVTSLGRLDPAHEAEDLLKLREKVMALIPRAAAHARRFEFHPTQVFEDGSDGSLVVRFEAAGHLDMAWHLYMCQC